ncbi:MAG: winged helix-turn-helix transcriptional regulator [Ruminococcaceae bacterium]|nr:winged helix-turn-helix transcriptional regulator [Oscillospiraceae bacterium]
MPSIMKDLNTVSRCMALYRAEQLPNEGLKAKHHSFVFVICATPGLSQDQIARRLCLNKSTVARSLDQLEALGLITRVPSASDKRVTQIYPTNAMLELYPKIREIAKTWNEGITVDCTARELEIFLSVLNRITRRARILTGQEGADPQ